MISASGRSGDQEMIWKRYWSKDEIRLYTFFSYLFILIQIISIAFGYGVYFMFAFISVVFILFVIVTIIFDVKKDLVFTSMQLKDQDKTWMYIKCRKNFGEPLLVRSKKRRYFWKYGKGHIFIYFPGKYMVVVRKGDEKMMKLLVEISKKQLF